MGYDVSMANIKQNNYCIDWIKGIACIFVVFMHCEFPGLLGTAVQAISRFCVPFFFMVSGYYCYKPLVSDHTGGNSNNIRRKVVHIGKITLYASLFYVAFVLLQHAVFHNVNFIITGMAVFNWVVFNVPKVVAGQYWFLFALLYAYIFYGILERFYLRRVSYILAAVMFVVYVIMAHGMHLVGINIPNFIYRNWLVEAFPFFMLGHWIHENQDRISVQDKTLTTVIVVSTLLCWIERWIMGRDFGVNIVTIPQVTALFLYGVKNPVNHQGAIQRLGRDCSMMVYILHPAVWHSMDGLYSITGLAEVVALQYIKPILVLGVSILFSILFNNVMAMIKLRKAIA